ncbi:hypothetical protein ACFLYW_02445 [Thermodesulfobacteriota bacterium]
MTIDQHIAAGIDLGSNTFRLLVASRTAENLKILEKRLVTVRLGRGLAENQILQKHAMAKGLDVLGSFRKILDHYQPQSFRVCGTEALRLAKNSFQFLQKAEKILQNKIDIISGEEEAHISLAGALSGWEENLADSILLVDVGGGSTEFIHAYIPSGQTQVASLSLGVVSLTERYLDASRPELDALDEEIAQILSNCLKKLAFPGQPAAARIIGCGGTATSMAALDLGLTAYSDVVHGHILTSKSMENLWRRLIVLPAEKRNELHCLEDGRGEILPAGVRIYQLLLQQMQVGEIKVSDTGLLEGILLSSFQDISSMNSSAHIFTPKN